MRAALSAVEGTISGMLTTQGAEGTTYIPHSLMGQIGFDFDTSQFDFDVTTPEGRQYFFDTLEANGVTYSGNTDTEIVTGNIATYNPETAPNWLIPREVATGQPGAGAWVSYEEYVSTNGNSIPDTFVWGGVTYPTWLQGTWADRSAALAELNS